MSREVLQMALDALEHVQWKNWRTDKAITAIRAELAKPDGWQPIETAPKDGSEVTLGNPDGSLAIGWWSNESRAWFDGDMVAYWATHWMPIPATPPAPSQEQG